MIVNEANVESVLKDNSIVLLDFWATWCPPCVALNPIIENVRQKTSAIVGKVNLDENPKLAMKYNISAIPTLVFIRNEEVVEVAVGLQTEDFILDKLSKMAEN